MESKFDQYVVNDPWTTEFEAPPSPNTENERRKLFKGNNNTYQNRKLLDNDYVRLQNDTVDLVKRKKCFSPTLSRANSSDVNLEDSQSFVGAKVVEVNIPKPENQLPLGIILSNFDDRHFISCVLKNRPGWHAGLEFGDEILYVNDKSVKGLKIKDIMIGIKVPPIIKLKIAKDSFITRHVLIKPVDESKFLGLWLRSGVIVGVDENSACSEAGLRRGQVIISIDGSLSFGLSNSEVATVLQNAASTAMIKTMPLRQFLNIMRDLSLKTAFDSMTES